MTSEAELRGHNQTFLTQSYVKGFIPTKADADLFELLLGGAPTTVAWLSRMAEHPTFNPFGKAAEESFELFDDEPAATKAAPPPATKAAPATADTDDEKFDVFSEETEEEKEVNEAKKKSDEAKKKDKPPGKSSLVIDVKPWDDETDMKVLEAGVRAITMDGLVWGQSQFVEVAYGLRKLQIMLTIEDDKVGTDDLEEKICALNDHVQSMDIVVFNKV
jgi:elongation factor 1-beta